MSVEILIVLYIYVILHVTIYAIDNRFSHIILNGFVIIFLIIKEAGLRIIIYCVFHLITPHKWEPHSNFGSHDSFRELRCVRKMVFSFQKIRNLNMSIHKVKAKEKQTLIIYSPFQVRPTTLILFTTESELLSNYNIFFQIQNFYNSCLIYKSMYNNNIYKLGKTLALILSHQSRPLNTIQLHNQLSVPFTSFWIYNVTISIKQSQTILSLILISEKIYLT